MAPATFVKEPHAEPIPGYRLLEPLGRGGFGEVWKCEAPGGLTKAIKFVAGPVDELDTSDAAEDELKAVQRIKSLRHPFLLSMERVERINGELVIVMELADRSLADLLAERRAAGRPGIDRAELLGYLREAADVLDLMNGRHGLQHLDIKPANLFLVSDHVKVADFGLVQSLTERTQTPVSPLGAVTPRYAAPELFRGKISLASDQYSLALVYQELLTGTLPFDGKNFRALMLQHTAGEPDLSPLPESDRPVVARALAKDPAARWPSCREFVQALVEAGDAARTADTRDDVALASTQAVGPELGQCWPDLQFTGSLGRTPAGEAWSARDGTGRSWVVHLLYGVAGRLPRQGEEAVARLQGLSHAGLPARRAAVAGRGCVAVANELVEMSLRARYQECRARGGTGLPRRELLAVLRAAAATLDDLFEQHGLPHLGLHPRNLLLDGDHVLVGDFGLLPVLYHPAGQLAAQVQARYAAPEVLDGQTGRTADVYSLAVIYQEMLTGTHPFRGRPAARGTGPQLAALPASDQSAVARALDPDPGRRFAGCVEFVLALEGADRGPRAEDDTVPTPGNAASNARLDVTPDPAARLGRLLEEAAAATPPCTSDWQTGPDGAAVLQGRFAVSLPPEGAITRFEGFKKRWGAQLVRGDEGSALFRIGVGGGFWRRLRGARPELLVEVTWTRSRPPAVPLPEVVVRVRAAGLGGEAALKEQGPALLDSLKQQFCGQHERRGKERVLWARPVTARFVLADGQPGEPIECQGKDLSLTGMGLYLPCALAGAEVRLNLTPENADDPVVVTGQFVRVQRCGGGWYEAGVLFQ